VNRAPVASAEQATIGKSLFIKGEITGSESLFVDGKVEGSINLARVCDSPPLAGLE